MPVRLGLFVLSTLRLLSGPVEVKFLFLFFLAILSY